MKILLTGGTGLIGLAFIRRFDEYQYTVLTRSPEKAKSLLPESVTLIESLDNLPNLNGFDAVINLAGEAIIDKRWHPKQKDRICQSRWQMTQKLADLFARSENPPETFLSGSAIGVYGNRGDDVLTEASTVQEHDFATTLCLRWEAIARGAESYTRVVLLRTGIVLAAHSGALAKMLLPFKCCLGGRIGDGQQYMSWIHLQDHVNAMGYLLTEKSISGPVNLVAPEPVRNNIFTQTLAEVLQRIAIFPVPKSILKLLLGESSCLLLDSQRVMPEALLNKRFSFAFPTLNQALTHLLKDTPASLTKG